MQPGIRHATTAFAAALRAGDARAAAALYAEDGAVLTPDADLITGRPAIERFWQAGIGIGLHAVHVRPPELDLAGDDRLHVQLGSYRFCFELDGRSQLDEGRYVVVLRRRDDGHWYRVVDVLNPARPNHPHEEQR